jgi:hypothetical protein
MDTLSTTGRKPPGDERPRGVALIGGVLVAALLLLSACGGGSSTTAGVAVDRAKIFLGPQAEKQLAGFVKEASDTELEEAASVVASSLNARAHHDWAGQCATLSSASTKKVVGKSGKECATALGEEAKRASPGVLDDNMRGEVIALRIKGRKGYALFRGAAKSKWAMPMEKDGSHWKVASLVATQLPPS